MTKLVSRSPQGLWTIQHQDGQFLADDPVFWTVNPQLALRFSSEDDAQHIGHGLARLHTVMMGKRCWEEPKGETVSLLKPVLLYCCEPMRHHSTLSCTVHASAQECPDVLVTWSNQHGPGLPVRDGGSSFVGIKFCPWCGALVSHT